jgi:hypothetical protein
MEPNPYRRALFNTSLLALAAWLLFGLFSFVTSAADPVASAFWSDTSFFALIVGIVFMALWLVVSALRYEAPAVSAADPVSEAERDASI